MHATGKIKHNTTDFSLFLIVEVKEIKEKEGSLFS
jgi:hypothetical protein